MFQNSSKKFNIFTISIAIVVVFTTAIFIQSLFYLKQKSEEIIEKSVSLAYEEKRKELKNYVTLAYKTVDSYYKRTAKEKIKDEVKYYLEEQSYYLFSILNSEYERNKDKLSEEELKEKLIAIVKGTRYGKSGYFWINSFDYKMIMHPIQENLTDRFFRNNEDVPFVGLGIKKLKDSKKDEGFIEYSFYSPRSEKRVFKASFVKVFKPYNWILGTGAYIDDVSKSMKEEALKAILQMGYGKEGYFWIIDSNHNLLMDGGKKTLAVENKYNVKNSKGQYIYRDIVKIANNKNEDDFLTYHWTIPEEEGEFEKLSFVKKFEPWDFIIGTGVYVKDINKNSIEMNKELESNTKYFWTLIIMFLMMVYLIITLFISIQKRRKTQKKLKNKTVELDNLNKNLEEKVLNRTLEIRGQKVLLQSIIDSQECMIAVTDFKKISFTNQSFKNFFSLKDKSEFEQRFVSLADVFCEYGEYIHKEKIAISVNKDSFAKAFYQYVVNTKEDKRTVMILNKNLEPKTFFINIKAVDKEKDLYLVSLIDITRITLRKLLAEQKAYTDELTGVANRNKFNEVFKKELLRVERYGGMFSIAILDIDNFKKFNDNFGHLIGDEVLISLASECKKSLRAVDLFARWGGEEFIILFPETKIEDAIISSKKLRKNIENLKHKTAGKITCSFGVTSFKENDTLEKMFERADKALYNAKKNGKNRVETLDD